jgi:hypothetical protein
MLHNIYFFAKRATGGTGATRIPVTKVTSMSRTCTLWLYQKLHLSLYVLYCLTHVTLFKKINVSILH